MFLRQILILSLLMSGGCATLKQGETQKAPQAAQFGATDQMDFESMVGGNQKSSKKGKTGSYNPTKSHSYAGERGYLNRPPVFADPRSEKMFQRCQPVEITGVYQTGQSILVYAKQGSNNFVFTGINRKAFTTGKNKRLPLLDQYFVKDLSWNGNRSVASQNQKACTGQTWRDMPVEQFLFVTGDPESRKPMTTAQGHFDVWTYVGNDSSQPRHYYFVSGRLYSWTN